MNDGKQPAIVVKDLHKSFRLPHEQSSGLKQTIVNFTSRKKGYEKQEVLNGVSFEIKKGEFFGIVGRNGSGKSTLLKLLAGIYTPDSGHVQVNGSLTPFIELGVGFNPELTGRENVFMNGALLGFSNKEMSVMYDDIVEFAEIEKFMDQKLKNYSSGMQVRLAFSIAIRANTDILVLDEVLAVGDEAFQRKCFEYFARLKKERKTVILVTHDMASVRRFCTRALLIDKGKILVHGNIDKVTEKYQELNQPKVLSKGIVTNKKDNKNFYGDIRTQILSQSNKTMSIFKPDERVIGFKNTIIVNKDIKNAFFGFTIWKEDGGLAYWYTTESPHPGLDELTKGRELTVSLNIQNIFGEGRYRIATSLKSLDRTEEYIINNDSGQFIITGRGVNGWMLHPDVEVSIG